MQSTSRGSTRRRLVWDPVSSPSRRCLSYRGKHAHDVMLRCVRDVRRRADITSSVAKTDPCLAQSGRYSIMSVKSSKQPCRQIITQYSRCRSINHDAAARVCWESGIIIIDESRSISITGVHPHGQTSVAGFWLPSFVPLFHNSHVSPAPVNHATTQHRHRRHLTTTTTKTQRAMRTSTLHYRPTHSFISRP